MKTIVISQVALLIFWFALAMLMFIMALIARFYEANTNQPTYYRWYALPVVLMGFSAVRYVSLHQWGGDPVADGVMFIGGMALLGLCLRLYYSMTNGRKN